MRKTRANHLPVGGIIIILNMDGENSGKPPLLFITEKNNERKRMSVNVLAPYR